MFPPRNSMPLQGFNMQPRFGGLQQQVANPSQGGFLKKLFSGSSQAQGLANPSNMMQGMANPSNVQGMLNSSTLKGLTNPANLSSMMGNVQKALQMAETVGPMVQQYGPLVKNIPAMWKIYKEMKSDDDNSDNSDTELDTETAEITERELPKEKEKSEGKAKPKAKPKDSVPKLYV